MVHEKLATFEHPAKAYVLEYPEPWECLVQDEGRSCGFGPQDRDNVGLWITILPFRADTEALQADLRPLFEQAVGQGHLANIRPDPTLRHFAMRGDSTETGQGGNSWLVAGGDILLLASSQFPPAERDQWIAPFDRLMASLRITRDDEVFGLKVTHALLAHLRRQFPDAGYEVDGERIRGGDRIISPASLIRQIRLAPEKQAELIERFVTGLVLTGDDAPSAEGLDAVRDLIVPILKPSGYVRPDGPAAAVTHRAWVGDLIICYAIRGGKTLRFVLGGDRERWRTSIDGLHEIAMANLQRLRWPKRLQPSGGPGPGMVVLSSRDGFDASRILHPGLHALAAPVLGSPFLAGVPDRDTLLVFRAGDSRSREQIAARLREDFARAAYPVSPRLFLVRPDHITIADPD